MAIRTAPTIELCNERRQCGTASFNSSKTVSVVFSPGFTMTPRIVACPLSNPPAGWWVESKTTSGFDLKLPSNSTIVFDWIALQNL